MFQSSGNKNSAGQKVKKKVTEYLMNPTEIKEVDYLDSFKYSGKMLNFFPTAEGYVRATPTGNITPGSPPTGYAYNYVFNYTDHLGNIRLSYTKDPQQGTLKILEENHYYPFGLKHEVYVTGSKRDFIENSNDPGETILTNVLKTDYQYKYNGKEWQDELGLNFYEYGARNYDPAIGRWMNMDPLAEKFIGISSYAIVANNPIIYFDPDGRDIYKYDEDSGEFTLMEKKKGLDLVAEYNKDGTLAKDKDGNMKVLMENIAKGILHDGINFTNDNNTIAVNGTNEDGTRQPTESSVESFALKLSKFLNKEVSGYGLGSEGSNDISNILIFKTELNSKTDFKDIGYNYNSIIHSERLNLDGFQGNKANLRANRYAKYHFHTHPDVEVNRPGGIDTPSKSDKGHAGSAVLPHFIINSNGKFPYNENGPLSK